MATRKNRPSDDELTRLYAVYTSTEIAKLFSVDPSSVRNWLRDAGVERRNTGSRAPVVKHCSNCGQPVGPKGSHGRCPRCVVYWKKYGSERPDGYKNPRYRDCPFSLNELYKLYWIDEQGAEYIAALVDPPVYGSTVQRWLREFNIPVRDRKASAAITAKRIGASKAVVMRQALAVMRLNGFVANDARQLHTPEVRAKVAAANKARAKKTNKHGAVSKSYLDIFAELTDKQRRKAIDGKSGFHRLRSLKRL